MTKRSKIIERHDVRGDERQSAREYVPRNARMDDRESVVTRRRPKRELKREDRFDCSED